MKVFVHTLGCRVNQYESQMIRERLSALPGEGEIHVVNTCTVTALADRKGRKLVRRLKREHPGALVVAVGCQADGAREELLSSGADLVLDNRYKPRIAEAVAAFLKGEPPPGREWEPLGGERVRGFPRTRALLKVQDGCTVGCSFCRTFLVRGPLRSKPPAASRQEAEGLAEAHREIVVVGINLAQYGLDLPQRPTLADLLEELLKVKGVRYRLGSLNPEGVTDPLVELFAEEPRLCPYFHLPLQSGADRILRAMGRPYSAAEYRERAQRLLERVPKATLGADVMVGFPGEDERAFQETIDLLEALVPLNVHIFRFSPRPGTKAAYLKPRVPARVQARRAAELAALASQWAGEVAAGFVGRTLEVLLERKEGRLWWGHAENYLLVGVGARDGQRGKIASVRVLRQDGGRAVGVMIDRPEDA
ncbi:MiaB/RimO family radical SAM methylthiotransferase [Candidatus Bipolaricaulota bacterium]|nr:MiaB/RimO family radical SAM methylthiotransferase [Candidatus Bipolaricaulota bacterium]